MRWTTQDDIKHILFGPVVTVMVKECQLADPMALLYEWVYYVTMEGRSCDRIPVATFTYVKNEI